MPLSQANPLYRLILDHALDAFVAIDEQSRIIEWSRQAEVIFGWTREEAIGMALTDTLIPERYRAAHLEGMRRFLDTGEQKLLGRRIEISARRKDGTEIPVELAITPLSHTRPILFSASLRDISRSKELEHELRHQANITSSILDSMAGAVAVADLSGRIILINPAGQRLLNLQPADVHTDQTHLDYQLYRPDGETPYSEQERPMSKALRGEQVNGMIALVRHKTIPEGIWVSANARPLLDNSGALIGGVVVFHDITELRRRETDLAAQTRLLQEQASLLDLARDAILVHDENDALTYLNRSAEKLYEFSRQEAIGKNIHALLKTRFPLPLDEIRAIVAEQHYWEGELRQRSKSGREIVVFSQWALDITDSGRARRYLETNSDITQRTKTEQALRQVQENYRLIVENSPDFAIIMTDPKGTIVSWNLGAEKIVGLSSEEAVGHPIDEIFTPEDRSAGKPWAELEEAKATGRAEDIRWHLRRDGTRFWSNGVVMPLFGEDGSLRGFVKIMRDQTAERLAQEKTQFLANHDVLTGLPNRVHFSNELHRFIALADRNRIPLAVLLLDLDRFKSVNDTLGHHAGDLLLREVAGRILSSLRETDFVARLGGDEFVVVQSDVSQPDAAETLAGKLVAELGRPYDLDGREVISGTSIGIATYPADAKSSVELLKRADLALYRAKSDGRGTYQLYTPDLSAQTNWRKDREQALRKALKNGEFELYYQPQVDLDDWTISTVEALLRWQATEREMVLPDDFLDVAEDTGLIVEIGEWALREACAQARAWQEHGISHLRISVNCSARQFGDPEFVKRIGPILRETELASSSLELEISQSMIAAHPEIKPQLAELRSLGVRITIDNYGTGSTALIDLKDFEIDGLKIDKQFVQHLPYRHKDCAITSTIISLAHNLGIRVSAGGVETAEQLAYVKARDCTSAQGFIFSPPVPAEKMEEMIMSGHWSRINRPPGLSDAAVFNDLH
jgi:diguanylate cyclase (GGDEF)-like protein/PAS domain S-box-containing protein